MNQEYSYKVKGINSDSDTCECCGKTGLNKVVWIVEIDQDGNETSSPIAYGTTCAAHKMNFGKGNTKAQNERKIIEAQAEYKKQARATYFETECIKVPFGNSAVFIEKQYKIGQIMQEQEFSRNEAINWAKRQMNAKWFMS